MSLDDEEAIAAIDPDMADAVRLFRLNKTGTAEADDAVIPVPLRSTSILHSGTYEGLASNVTRWNSGTNRTELGRPWHQQC